MRLYFPYHSGGQGFSYGFGTHTLSMIHALEAAGVKITTKEQERADLAVHITAPYQFKPTRGKRNILFTTAETVGLMPVQRFAVLREAVALVVPTQFSADQFGRFFPEVPIEICPEGIDPVAFPYFQRKMPAPGERFRFLWIGSSGVRKGPTFTFSAWVLWRKTGRLPDNAELYFKTTAPPDYRGPTGISRARDTRVILDSRNINTAQLNQLYRSAHCFVFPTTGEGWGLPLGESFATGCPAIYTDFSAPHDYADETLGFPLRNFEMREILDAGIMPTIARGDLSNIPTDKLDLSRFEMPTLARQRGDHFQPRVFSAWPNPREIMEKMEYIYTHYDEAIERGRRASERMHAQYTWANAARRLIEVCEKYINAPLPERRRQPVVVMAGEAERATRSRALRRKQRR